MVVLAPLISGVPRATLDGMQRRTFLSGAAAAGLAPTGLMRTGGRPGPSAVSAISAIKDVTVVDAFGARRQQTVLVKGDRILDVGERISIPYGSTTIDGRGRYLIPGLADMHSHNVGIDDTDPELYVVNGVTTTRQMSADAGVRAWRTAIEAGQRIGPHWTVGSRILDGSPSLWDGLDADGSIHLAVADPGQARAAVRQEQAAGAEFIKTYTRLTRDSFLAIADESHRAGIPFLGHIPDFVEATEAIDAGLRTVEHLFEFWYDLSTQEQRIRRDVTQVPIGPGDYNGWFNRMHPYEYEAARTLDPRKADRLFERLVRNGTWVTPTLTVHWTSDTPQDIDPHDPRYRYFSADVLGYWQWALDNIYLAGRSAEQTAQRRELFQRRLRLCAAMAEAGVPLLTGTDLGTTYLMPGFSLHDELALLVKAGLSPLRAIAGATYEPARYEGRRDKGVVRRGAVADLVLLDADPLRDIRNTTRINSVLTHGRLIGPAEREQLLKDVEERAAQVRVATAKAVRGCPC
jgi:imidazolonepropionase-like amidohydrolase